MIKTPAWISVRTWIGGRARPGAPLVVNCAHRFLTLGLAFDRLAPEVFASHGMDTYVMTAVGGFSLTAETHVEQDEGQNECEERGLIRIHLTVIINASERTWHGVHRPSSDSACMVVSAERGEHRHAHAMHYSYDVCRG